MLGDVNMWRSTPSPIHMNITCSLSLKAEAIVLNNAGFFCAMALPVVATVKMFCLVFFTGGAGNDLPLFTCHAFIPRRLYASASDLETPTTLAGTMVTAFSIVAKAVLANADTSLRKNVAPCGA